ncbi:MAG: CotH kinase family protein, partial [Bacteroidales bacterium]|nr:CotH kinase family protein [Bacteroidales bacterium]
DYKIDMILEEINSDTLIIYNGKIERRGGGSIVYPKFSFEIDLEEDVPLGNLPTDDDWILNANYIDKTFMRHTLSYDLFRDMHSNNESSKYKYAEVNLNDSYNGLYVLMEKLDKSSLGINKQDTNAVIFKEPPLFRFDIDSFIPQSPNNFYQQIYPDIDDRDMTAFIEDVRELIMSSSNSTFSETITDIFDIDNIIDWHLLLLLSNNGDGILKNFYLYKIDSSTPLRIAPWDYDHSFGRDGDNELNLIRPLDLERSNLISRLLEIDWYKTALKERWNELNNQNLFTPGGLKSRIDNFRTILDGLVEKNFEKWPVNGYWYYDDNNYDEEIEIMEIYIDMRHDQLDEYFGTI